MLTQNYQGNQWYHACICRSKHFAGEDALFYHHENKSIENFFFLDISSKNF